MPKSTSKRTAARCRGLSRLEFAVALVVIAVLASVLLTRLAELGDAARRQQLLSTVSTVRTVASIFHARCIAAQTTGGADCSRIAMGGDPVSGVNRWPAASIEGIARAAALPADALMPSGRFDYRSGVVHGRPALFIALGDRHCEFSYAQAMSLGDSPEVDVVDASCH